MMGLAVAAALVMLGPAAEDREAADVVEADPGDRDELDAEPPEGEPPEDSEADEPSDAGPPVAGAPGDEPPAFDPEFGPSTQQDSEPDAEDATPPARAGEPKPEDGAAGGRGHTPLPAAPPPSKGRITPGPWRGVGWVELRIDFVAPVGGKTPARGNVLTGAGGLWAGWRPHPLVGLHGGVTTFIHDQDTRVLFDDSTGETREVGEFGRLTLVDLAVVRAFIPTKGRVQPFFDVGGFVGAYRAPFSTGPRAAGGGRFGVGVDFWLGQTFTLSIAFDERLIAIGRSVGHTLQTGAAAGLHF